jgi:hypothetical protein
VILAIAIAVILSSIVAQAVERGHVEPGPGLGRGELRAPKSSA